MAEAGRAFLVDALSRETRIGMAAAGLAVGAMAVDHLLEDGGAVPADLPAFAIASVLSLAVAALVFGRVVPRAKASADGAERQAKAGIACSLLAVLAVPTALWLGLPFVLGGGGVALGLLGRHGERRRLADAAVALGALVLLLGASNYVVQAVAKLS